MAQVAVWYVRDPYVSFSRAAASYVEILRREGHLAASPKAANIIVLHNEPHDYEKFYQRFPLLREKYVVSYCVWKASELPETYKKSLELVQEVWTCSHYSYLALSKSHPNVKVLPHVIERNLDCDEDNLRLIKGVIRYDQSKKYLLHVGRTLGTRKNIHQLVQAFEATMHELPHVNLIIKTRAGEQLIKTEDPRVISVPFDFSDLQMNALYKIANGYVSVHHAEGWGFTISDALLFKLPILTTGYSGSLEFANETSASLVPCIEGALDAVDANGLFTQEMKWGYMDTSTIRHCLIQFCKSLGSKKCKGRVSEGLRICGEFSSDKVACKLRAYLNGIVGVTSAEPT